MIVAINTAGNIIAWLLLVFGGLAMIIVGMYDILSVLDDSWMKRKCYNLREIFCNNMIVLKLRKMLKQVIGI